MNCSYCGAPMAPAQLLAAKYKFSQPPALAAVVPTAWFCPNCDRVYCVAHSQNPNVRMRCGNPACRQYSCYLCRSDLTSCSLCTPRCVCGVPGMLLRRCSNCGLGHCAACEPTLLPLLNACTCARTLCVLCAPAVGGWCPKCERDHALQAAAAAAAIAMAVPVPPPYVHCSAQPGTHKPKLTQAPGGLPQSELLEYGCDLVLCPRCHQPPNTHAVPTMIPNPCVKEDAQSRAHIQILLGQLGGANPIQEAFMFGVLVCQDATGNTRILAARSGNSPATGVFHARVAGLPAPPNNPGWVNAPDVPRGEQVSTQLIDTTGRHLYPRLVKDPDCQNQPGQCAAPKLVQAFIALRLGAPASNWRIVSMTEAWHDPNNQQPDKTHGASYSSCETCQDTLVRMFCSANPVINHIALRTQIQGEINALWGQISTAALTNAAAARFNPPPNPPTVGGVQAQYGAAGIQTLATTANSLRDQRALAQLKQYTHLTEVLNDY